MNFSNLVERIVPLVAELFATLASRDPLRMHFADIAGKTLLDIVQTLRSDGISQEAIAASLEMTITGFRAKMKKLAQEFEEVDAVPGDAGPRTLLERVHGFVYEEGGDRVGTRYQDIADAFRGVKPDSLRGVLHFLVQSGVLSVTGRGATREYRTIPQRRADSASLADAVVMLYRDGPMTVAELAHRLEVPTATARRFVERLEGEGRLEPGGGPTGETTYKATSYHVPMGSADGYEAALWDHFQAVVRSVNKKVRLGRYNASLHDVNGGTTFSFDVAEDSELFEELSGFLQSMRVQMEAWRERALEEVPPPGTSSKRVTIYTGQMVEDRDADA